MKWPRSDRLTYKARNPRKAICQSSEYVFPIRWLDVRRQGTRCNNARNVCTVGCRSRNEVCVLCLTVPAELSWAKPIRATRQAKRCRAVSYK